MRYFWLIALLVCAGCTTNVGGGLPKVNIPNVAAISKLQFAVGTAMVGEAGGSEIGLNVVTTFRQPGGGNATLQNTPTLSGPTTFFSGAPAGTDPHAVVGMLPPDLALLAQNLALGLAVTAPPSLSEFGVTVGVFGFGLVGDNTLSPTTYQAVYGTIHPCPDIGGAIATTNVGSQTSTGYNAARSQELALPALALPQCSGQYHGDFTGPVMSTDYYGGPPAWPSPQGYNQPLFFQGYPLGFADFASHPVAGTYFLKVQFATSNDYSTFATMSATAVLPAGALANPLPVFAQPVLHVQTDGSALIDVVVPAGVSEAVINVKTPNCQLALNKPQNHFSLLTRVSGRQTLFLSSHLGPPDASGNPTHTFCTLADVAAAQALQPGTVFPTSGPAIVAAVGFDYPMFEASYPQSVDIAPPITNGASGTADVTTANPAILTYNYGTGP